MLREKRCQELGDLQATPAERAAGVCFSSFAASNTDVPARAINCHRLCFDMAGGTRATSLRWHCWMPLRLTQIRLRERFSSVTIATSQLWRNRPPDWVLESWEELKQALIAENEGWMYWSLLVTKFGYLTCDPRTARKYLAP